MSSKAILFIWSKIRIVSQRALKFVQHMTPSIVRLSNGLRKKPLKKLFNGKEGETSGRATGKRFLFLDFQVVK